MPKIKRKASLGQNLTPRECEVLALIYFGMKTKDVAAHLLISPSTVEVHVDNARIKLGTSGMKNTANKAATEDLVSEELRKAASEAAKGRFK